MDLLEDFLKDKIPMAEFFAELRIKNYAIIKIVPLLESHRIILSVDQKASKFSELIKPINDGLEGYLSYTRDEYRNFISCSIIIINKFGIQ